MRAILSVVVLSLGLCPAQFLVSTAFAQEPSAPPQESLQQEPRLLQGYGKLPLVFEANQGQPDESDADGTFLARGRGYTLFLQSDEAVLALERPARRDERQGVAAAALIASDPTGNEAVVRMRLVGAASDANVAELDGLPGTVNYFIGSDPTGWRTAVPTYSKVRYGQVYPGVDLVYYGNQGQLEYDFVVAPGADPDQIVLEFEGVETLDVDASGDLVLHTAGGELRQRRPAIYQNTRSGRQEIAGGYVLTNDGRVGFQVTSYDRSRSLVIDPILVYSDFFGAGTGRANGIAVDALGNAYVTGSTRSDVFPIAGNVLQPTFGGDRDVFVSKISPDGSTRLYSTYLGGSKDDVGLDIAIDAAGNAYVVGTTTSADLPMPGTPSPLQAELNGDGDAFVAKLSADGSALVYSTFLGGGGLEEGNGIAVDPSGNAYVTGRTHRPGDLSNDFPTTSGVVQPNRAGFRDAFVTKLSADGSSLAYSTFLGGGGHELGFGIAVDGSGSAYVTGITKFTDSANNPSTQSPFPTHNPFQRNHGGLTGTEDAFVTKINSDGSALVYSTFLGGSDRDNARGITVDGSGHAYVTGFTHSLNFPVSSPLQPSFIDPLDINGFDAFVTKFSPDGSGLVYSTFLGGDGLDQGIDVAVRSGVAYVGGVTRSTDFPTTPDAIELGLINP